MHNDWEELIPFYVAGTLPKADSSRLENHLARCAECSKSVEEWRKIATVVRAQAASQLRGLPPLAPEVTRIAAQQAAARQSFTPFIRRRVNTPIALVAALLTVFLFGALVALIVVRGMPEASGFVVLLPSETATIAPTEVSSATPQPEIIVIEPTTTPVPLKVSPTPLPPTEMLPPTAVQPPTVIAINPVLVLPTQPFPTRIPPTQALPTALLPPTETDISGQAQTNLMTIQGQTCTLHAAAPGVKLYAGAGTEYPIMETITDDDELVALGMSADGWYNAQYPNGTVGWVQQAMVYTSGNCDSVPVLASATEPTAIPPIVDSPLVLIPSNSINLRGGPGTDYPQVGRARSGESYHVEAQYARQNRVWYRLTIPGAASAWISASLVQLSPSNAVIPPADAIPLTPAAATPAPTVGAANPAIKAGRWSQTVSVSASSCGATDSASATAPITLALSGDTLTLSSDDFPAPLTLTRSGDRVYAGGSTTADASVSVTLTFSSATRYTGSAMTAQSDGCTVISTWNGTYAGT